MKSTGQNVLAAAVQWPATSDVNEVKPLAGAKYVCFHMHGILPKKRKVCAATIFQMRGIWMYTKTRLYSIVGWNVLLPVWVGAIWSCHILDTGSSHHYKKWHSVALSLAACTLPVSCQVKRNRMHQRLLFSLNSPQHWLEMWLVLVWSSWPVVALHR